MINPNDITTVIVDELPPASPSLTDIFPFETLSDRALKKATFQNLVDFININSNAFQFEVKTLLVNQSYITDNFDGLIGKNLCLGWRIANELHGLVTIGQGANYPVGGYGGSKDAVVVAHSHGIKYSTSGVGTKYPETPYIGDTIGGDMQGTSTVAVSGINKNMQPYLVALKISKL